MKWTEQNKSLKKCLFDRIEAEQVCPRARWSFLLSECVVWCLWFLFALVGAVAMAITLFVVRHHQYALFEATHDDFWAFMLDVLPYVWMFIFVCVALFAVYNFRHTKHGYRRPLWMGFVGSLIVSIVGGVLLHLLDLGYKADDLLGKYMPMYTSQEKMEHKIWQFPADGRLLGVYQYATTKPDEIAVFVDMDKNTWRLHISELSERDKDLLRSKKKVRLLGLLSNKEVGIFHVCDVFPWMLDPAEVSFREINEQRQRFIEQAHKHMEKEVIYRERRAVGSTSEPVPISECANIAAIRRVPTW